MKSICLALLIVVGILPLSGAALTAEIQLRPLVVEAEFLSTDPLRVPLTPPASQRAMSESIAAADIEASGARTAIDILDRRAGLQNAEQYRKYRRHILLRGETPLVLLDGRPIGDDQRFLSSLPAGLIERVDVIRNSAGLIYGSADGANPVGVINIVTKRPSSDCRLLELEGGSWNRFRLGLARGFRQGRNGLTLHLSRDLCAGPDGRRAAEDFRHLYLAGERETRRGDRFDFRILREEGFMEIPRDEFVVGGNNSFARTTEWLYDPWNLTLVQLGWEQNRSERQATFIDAWFQRRDATNRWVSPLSVTPDSSIKDLADGFNLRRVLKSRDLRTTVRFGLQQTHVDNPTGKLYYVYKGGREYRNLGLYLQAEREWPGGLSLDAGLRRDRRHWTVDTAYWGPKGETVRDRSDPAIISWSAGLRKAWSSQLALSLRTGHGVRSPRDRGATKLAQPLSDEKQDSLDLALEWSPTRRDSVRFAFYRVKKADALVEDGIFTLGGTDYRAWRNADMEKRGLEMNWVRELSPVLALNLAASWNRYRSDEPRNALGGNAADQLPARDAWAGLSWQEGKNRLELGVKQVGRYWSYEAAPGPGQPLRAYAMGDYRRVDLSWQYRLRERDGRRDTLRLAVRNLTDRRYFTMNGHHNPDFGRSWRLGWTREWD